MENEFPGNRRVKPPTEPQQKKLDKVEVTRVVRRKQPLGKRFAQLFIAGDSRTVSQYVLLDVLMPAFKDMVTDAVSGGFERMIYGEGTTPRSRRSGSSSNYVSYNRFAQPATSTRPGPPRDIQPAKGVMMSRQGRANHNFDELILNSRHEADEILASMEDAIVRYGTVSVSDLYDIVGETASFADEKWGWTDLGQAGVTRTRNGYLLDLPRPVPLD